MSDSGRWHQSGRVVWALIAALAALMFAWGGLVWSKTSSGEITNVRQDEQLHGMQRQLDRIESKLDKALEKQR